MLRLSFFAFIGGLLLYTPQQANAWGNDGHIIIGLIAEAHLTPKTQKALRDILDARSIADPRICVWADEIRRSSDYNKKYPNHPTWHYINIELQDKFADFKPDLTGDSVLGAINRFTKFLKDPNSKPEDRKEALFFVIHFLEDMHQPLHCSNRNDDKGGNMQLIKSFNGKVDRLNLHRVWDVDLVNAEKGSLNNIDYAKRVRDEITEAERTKWKKGKVQNWVWEVHEIGVKNVYRFADGTELPKIGEPSAELTNQNYIDKSKPIVREQLKCAGIRLAAVLNECLDPQ